MAAWSDKRVVKANRVGQPRAERETCGDAATRGWRGFRWHEPPTVGSSAAPFYCPEPAERAFGDQ